MISPARDSGVAPSRLSTPYRRSKPVAIAWLVNAVDMTARAITPGVRKSILVYPPPKSISGSRLNAASSSSGMIRVSVSCSPLRSSCLVSCLACAVIIRSGGAAPGPGDHVPRLGGGGRGPDVPGRLLAGQPLRSFPVSSRKTSSSVRDSICRLLGSTPRSAHQAVTAASRAG